MTDLVFYVPNLVITAAFGCFGGWQFARARTEHQRRERTEKALNTILFNLYMAQWENGPVVLEHDPDGFLRCLNQETWDARKN